jgi:hypothetical protein
VFYVLATPRDHPPLLQAWALGFDPSHSRLLGQDAGWPRGLGRTGPRLSVDTTQPNPQTLHRDERRLPYAHDGGHGDSWRPHEPDVLFPEDLTNNPDGPDQVFLLGFRGDSEAGLASELVPAPAGERTIDVGRWSIPTT